MNPPNDDLDADPRVVLDDLLEHRSDDPVPAEATMPERVLAVLVCHNGDQFLPRTLQALAALETKPDWLVAVDVGSTDDSLTWLRATAALSTRSSACLAGSLASRWLFTPVSTALVPVTGCGCSTTTAPPN